MLSERDRLIERHVPLVYKTVSLLGGNWRPCDREEMESVGMIALVEAVDSYDPTRGAALQTHILNRIRSAILTWRREQRPVSRWMRHVMESGEPLSDQTQRTLDRQMAVRSPLYLDARLKDGGARIGDLIPSDGRDSPERCLDGVLLSGPIARLPRRLRMILREMYWRGQAGREIAGEMGIATSRVYQLRDYALALLRLDMETTDAAIS